MSATLSDTLSGTLCDSLSAIFVILRVPLYVPLLMILWMISLPLVRQTSPLQVRILVVDGACLIGSGIIMPLLPVGSITLITNGFIRLSRVLTPFGFTAQRTIGYGRLKPPILGPGSIPVKVGSITFPLQISG